MTDPVKQPRSGTEIQSPRVAQKRRILHARLLELGVSLSARHGPANVSVEDIILAAGTSRNTFYGFFESKS